MVYFVKNMSGDELFKSEKASTAKEAVVEAVSKGAYLRGAYLRGADLGGADLRGADLGGADLGGADLRGADLGGADLRGADLGGAYLGGAYLGSAYLRGAYLGGADLGGAYLRGADLGDQWIIQGGCRSDGYWFFLQRLRDDKEPMIRAGCRYFTLAEAQLHWETTRAGTKLLDETREIVRAMVNIMHLRGLK
jgi:Pentapeptide repeats (8 copies)